MANNITEIRAQVERSLDPIRTTLDRGAHLKTRRHQRLVGNECSHEHACSGTHDERVDVQIDVHPIRMHGVHHTTVDIQGRAGIAVEIHRDGIHAFQGANKVRCERKTLRYVRDRQRTSRQQREELCLVLLRDSGLQPYMDRHTLRSAIGVLQRTLACMHIQLRQKTIPTQACPCKHELSSGAADVGLQLEEMFRRSIPAMEILDHDPHFIIVGNYPVELRVHTSQHRMRGIERGARRRNATSMHAQRCVVQLQSTDPHIQVTQEIAETIVMTKPGWFRSTGHLFADAITHGSVFEPFHHHLSKVEKLAASVHPLHIQLRVY